MLTNKQVCLAANPIILAAEFTSISDVQSQGDTMWFDLTLSPKAIQTMLQLSANLPDAKFALVVEKEVFYVFPASDLRIGRTLRFQVTSKDKLTFTEMQKKLKVVLASRTQ
jgi:hypothetical protein